MKSDMADFRRELRATHDDVRLILQTFTSPMASPTTINAEVINSFMGADGAALSGNLRTSGGIEKSTKSPAQSPRTSGTFSSPITSSSRTSSTSSPGSKSGSFRAKSSTVSGVLSSKSYPTTETENPRKPPVPPRQTRNILFFLFFFYRFYLIYGRDLASTNSLKFELIGFRTRDFASCYHTNPRCSSPYFPSRHVRRCPSHYSPFKNYTSSSLSTWTPQRSSPSLTFYPRTKLSERFTPSSLSRIFPNSKLYVANNSSRTPRTTFHTRIPQRYN